MADIINLRRARKTKQRSEADKTAAENRVIFGRTKAEKTLAKAKEELAARSLDGKKRGQE
jgi:hypothetical protein